MTVFQGKRILVAGLGKSGVAVLGALLPKGCRLFAHDSRSTSCFEPELLKMLENNRVGCYFGKTPAPEDRFDMLILSPGVPPDAEFVRNAARAGSEVIGEIELAYRLSKGRFIAITGTNGKTTVTALMGEIFKNAGKKAFVVGNIGTPATSAAEDADGGSWMITEASSFQLETTREFKPHVSVILNITPDHLDRHKNMENYIEAKAKICANQDERDYFVVNYDDKTAFGLAAGCRAKAVPFSRAAELEYGVFVKNGRIAYRGEGGVYEEFCGVGELLMPGPHNLENAMAAAAAAYCAGIPAQIIGQVLRSFAGVAHRLEFCGEVGGVKFVNDSKGTNPDATIKAIEALDGPIVLLAGGYDKKTDFGKLIDAFGGKVKHMVLMGDTAESIKKAAFSKGFFQSTVLGSMEECVNCAFGLAEPGGTVLLSPACASWDLYNNFEERGEHFKKCVRGLES
ncbi:MAG: UDP-N-acetylmuramoyl-L-alanine--D-glutamate ligase [Clostridiales bacterium]|nr:UDP-N-acetylmuramoyl-L-alanine--D-glutamate ligase [Clostridiales bacterium]